MPVSPHRASSPQRTTTWATPERRTTTRATSRKTASAARPGTPAGRSATMASTFTRQRPAWAITSRSAASIRASGSGTRSMPPRAEDSMSSFASPTPPPTARASRSGSTARAAQTRPSRRPAATRAGATCITGPSTSRRVRPTVLRCMPAAAVSTWRASPSILRITLSRTWDTSTTRRRIPRRSPSPARTASGRSCRSTTRPPRRRSSSSRPAPPWLRATWPPARSRSRSATITPYPTTGMTSTRGCPTWRRSRSRRTPHSMACRLRIWPRSACTGLTGISRAGPPASR